MVQFNLLPDIKLEYIKAAKLKRTVTVISILVSAAVLVIVMLLAIYTYVVRQGHLNNLNNDINSKTSELESTENINKILTIQNQIKSLPDLHSQKPNTTRLFDYLNAVVPSQLNITDLEVDFTENTMLISGESENLETINIFVDTLKFSRLQTYTVEDLEAYTLKIRNVESTEDWSEDSFIALREESEALLQKYLQSEAEWQNFRDNLIPSYEVELVGENTNAFTNVVLSDFAFEENILTFDIELEFNESLFDSTQLLSLEVPLKFTTRSEIEKPIFDIPTVKEDEE